MKHKGYMVISKTGQLFLSSFATNRRISWEAVSRNISKAALIKRGCRCVPIVIEVKK